MDGRPTAINPALERMLGYSAAELGEMVFADFTHPDDVAADLELFGELMAGKRESYRLEKRYIHANGDFVWGRLAVSLIRDENGAPEFALAMVEDVTELRRAEEALRLSEEQQRRAQKMEAIGRLAGGIAHDFNNLLTVVIGSADMLDANAGDDRKRSELVARIREAAERAAALTRQLLAFARRQRFEMQVTQLNQLLEETLTLLRRVIPSDIEIEWHLDPELATVEADPSQLEQVIMNLALNARDAMPAGGRLRITTANVTSGELLNTERTLVPPGDWVVLAVSDTGIGMSAATAAQVFEPFFTTKADGQGTGLGLSTVYGIVKQSRGFITVESVPEEGTVFTIYLPRTEEPEPDVELHGKAATRAATSGTILVVDDETAVRQMLADMLRARGYAVRTAADATDALRQAGEPGFHVDLVVSDLVMPGMGGAQLIATLRKRSDEPIRALFVSGYSDDGHQPEPGAHFLQKPFSTTTLVRAVEAAFAD